MSEVAETSETPSQQMPFFSNVSKLNPKLFVFLAFVLAALSLYNTFKIAYNGDDAVNSFTSGALSLSGHSIGSYTQAQLDYWLSTGRFYPLAFYSYALFALLPNLFAYRLYLFILNLLVIAAFSGVVYKISKRTAPVILAISLTPIFFQFRFYHDANISFHGLLQFVALFLFLAMIFQIHAIQTNCYLFLFPSAICYLACLLLYEVSFGFIAVFCLYSCLYCKSWKKLLWSIPHLTVLAAVLLTTMYFRLQATVTYPGVNFSFDFIRICRAFGIQLFSAVPLSYLVAYPHSQPYKILQMLFHFTETFSIYHIFILVLFAGLLIYSWKIYFTSSVLATDKKSVSDMSDKLVKQTSIIKTPYLRDFILIGLALWIPPAAIMSLSERYQVEMQWGLGYLPVYIQLYGGILIALTLTFLLLEKCRTVKIRSRRIYIFTACFCVALVLTQTSNLLTGKKFTQYNIQSMSTYALQHGLLDNLADGDRLFLLQGGVGPEPRPDEFVATYANGLKITPLRLDQLIFESQEISPEHDAGIPAITKTLPALTSQTHQYIFPENTYVFYANGDTTQGFAILARLESLSYDTETQTVIEAYFHEASGIFTGKETDIFLFESYQGEDLMTVELPVYELFADEEYSRFGKNSEIQRNSAIIKPNLFEQIFYLDQGDGFAFSINSKDEPILLRSFRLSIWT